MLICPFRPRSDLQLKYGTAADPPFPVENCLQVLRVTGILLENCSSKHLYSSYEVRDLAAAAAVCI
jgi:E3 ubiquitin-protein ligase HUWE1